MTLAPKPPARSTVLLALPIALALTLNFLFQFPHEGDWVRFAWYDLGTALKANLLIDHGLIPITDFGYTHGLLSLAFGRIGFALLGRTQWTFFALNLLLQLLMAIPIARILIAAKISTTARILCILLLPIAIPAIYLTLAHPLEALLILFALADHLERKPARALAFLTACLFVKPSMAYLYGLILVLQILLRRTAPTEPPLTVPARLRPLLPAAVTFLLCFVALALWLGPRPVLHSLFPIAGASAYRNTDFGFFTASGRRFWVLPNPIDYLITPVGLYLLAATAAFLAIPLAMFSRLRSHPLAPTLALLGFLNTIFLIAFYGWPGSWTYYAYMPILALVCSLALWEHRNRLTRILAAALIPLALLAYLSTFIDASIAWAAKSRHPEMGGFYTWNNYYKDWAEIRRLTHADDALTPRTTIVLSLGCIPNLPPGFEMPLSWFPDGGIATTSEIDRVRNQVDHADFVVCWHYNQFEDLWNTPQFRTLHGQFEEVPEHPDAFILYRRIRPPSAILRQPLQESP